MVVGIHPRLFVTALIDSYRLAINENKRPTVSADGHAFPIYYQRGQFRLIEKAILSYELVGEAVALNLQGCELRAPT